VCTSVAVVHTRGGDDRGLRLLAFRDIYGIRPLVCGVNEHEQGPEYLVASESVALDTLGFKFLRMLHRRSVFIDFDGNLRSQQCSANAKLNSCIFEYVYFARPDSVIDGVSVYETRRTWANISPITQARVGERQDRRGHPDPGFQPAQRAATGEPSRYPFREGFVKNRYIGRPSSCRTGVAQKIGAPRN